MLILTRKAGQGFRIGDDIEITITEITGDKIRVGIDAPKNIKVLRSELTETIEQNAQAISGVSAGNLAALAKGLGAGKKAAPQLPLTQTVNKGNS